MTNQHPELVFMVEEKSMKLLLDALLPKLVQDNLPYRVISHNGKGDLQRSIPHKIRGWTNPLAQFIILHDNDGGDCADLKHKITGMCSGRPNTHVCVVCQELESWFLGDLASVEKSKLARNVSGKQEKNPYRDPDHITDAKGQLRKICPTYYPSKAGDIAPNLRLENNRSRSFNHFIRLMRNIADTTTHS